MSVFFDTNVRIKLYHVLVNKQKMLQRVAADLLDQYALWPVVQSDIALVQSAVTRTMAQALSIWDSMVIRAANRCGAKILLSEDMGHGMRYEHSCQLASTQGDARQQIHALNPLVGFFKMKGLLSKSGAPHKQRNALMTQHEQLVVNMRDDGFIGKA